MGAWPWIAVAVAGALHGLNPLTGWAIAGWRTREDGGTSLIRALVPIFLGQLAAVAIVAAAVPASMQLGIEFSPWMAQAAAGAVLIVLAVRHFRAGAGSGRHAVRTTGVALWSFIAGTAHGAGWMLVPALAGLCVGAMPGKEIAVTGSLWLAIAALAVHSFAMLLTTAALAAGMRRLRQPICTCFFKLDAS